jgi:hypothetical protein
LLIKLRYILEVWFPRISLHSKEYDPDEFLKNKQVLALYSHSGAAISSQMRFINNAKKELNLRNISYKTPMIPPRSDSLENCLKLTFKGKQHYPYSPWEIMDRFLYLKK